ncbi:MAG: FAD-dependent oxidoreductase [Acidimicrobiia bacterium]|nr:FAD-dependent oxidoreductase [Acidimicrobiia bacterium]
MKNEARAVVIGGGIVGVAVLYHLTKLGWKDVVLVERKQLTAGSTWHAAAGFHSLNGSVNMARLQAYSIQTYDEVAEISEQDIGIHRVGTCTTAATPERWDFLKIVDELNTTLGIESWLVGPDEIPKYSRLTDHTQVMGALIDPADGYLDPYGATHAYAKAARIAGAEVYQQTLVTSLERRDDDTWNVITDQGTIHTEHVINAAGLWAREVGQMVGLELPLIPYEHHYLLTEQLAGVMDQKEESMVTVDLDGGLYVREEMGGLLFGVYEPNPIPWSLDGTPWSFGSELLEPRLEHLADSLEKGFERFPMMHDAGIKNAINGPFTFTPDGNPLMGPVRGMPGYWLACGCMAGFSQSGGVALALAQWIIDGETDEDTFSMDPARFGSFANEAYTLETSTQFYEWRFRVAFPNESWPAGRPAKTTPIYDLQKDSGAVFGQIAPLEVPMWFARAGEAAEDIPTFFRPNSFEAVGEEVAATTTGAGIIDTSSYSKFEVSGPNAREWLDVLLATKLPTPGRSRLGVMLSEAGRIIGDFTVFCVAGPDDSGSERFVMTGSGPMQEFQMRWFARFLPSEGVLVQNVTDQWMGLAIAGPRSRDVLQQLTRTDLSNEAFPFMSVADMNIGLAPARVDRLSLTGELGFEIWTPTMYMRHVYTKLHEAGADVDIRNVGVHALLSMRLEKIFGTWGREFSPDYTPSQNDMAHFVDYEKPGFTGRDAALADREKGADKKLVLLRVDATTSDVSGFEPVYVRDRVSGFVTSGGYGHRTGQSLALAYINVEDMSAETPFEIPLVGERHAAHLLQEPAFDPSGSRMRS